MPRFVLLRHDCPPGYVKPSHWDFMLEVENTLWTWELRTLPDEWATKLGMPPSTNGSMVTATRLPDHRLAYLDYEGPLTNDRGSVTRIARGDIEFLQKLPEALVVCVTGNAIQGTITLTENVHSGSWQLALPD